MDAFLAETDFCDINSSLIQKWINNIQHLDKISIAIKIHELIASMPYHFRPWNTKASDILRLGSGMCGNKANLQVALLRASGIPAGYGFMDISKETFKKFCPEEFYQQINEVTQHVFCYIYLDDRWIACDATPDPRLADIHKGMDIRHNNWDGQTDFKMPAIYILHEYAIASNLDDFFRSKTRFSQEKLDEINSKISLMLANLINCKS